MMIPPRNQAAAVTLADIARAAGVSEITVSRVVRSRGPIAPETRRRVEEAIARVGYVPNRLAGGLASAGSDLVGVVLPSLANIVFADVLRGLHGALAGGGLRAVVSVTEYDLDAERDAVAALLAWRPTAMIVTGLEHRPETAAMLLNAGVTVVEIMDVEGEPIDLAVGMSHTAAGAAAARRLIGRGRTRIGYVGHDGVRDPRAAKRRAGAEAALAKVGLRLESGRGDVPAASSVAAGREGLAALLAERPQLDAAMFSNDDMALGGVFHCLAEGVSVPDRLALVGFNGLDMAAALPRPLTTVRTAREDIGRIAGEHVLARRAGEDPARITDVGFELIAGATA